MNAKSKAYSRYLLICSSIFIVNPSSPIQGQHDWPVKKVSAKTPGINVGLSTRPDIVIQADIENSENCYD
jgi:hypothetical protein